MPLIWAEYRVVLDDDIMGYVVERLNVLHSNLTSIDQLYA
jgi:hypothetical protein